MQTGQPMLKANVFAAQLKSSTPAPAAPLLAPVAPAPVSTKKVLMKIQPAAPAAKKKRKLVIKVNPMVAKLIKKK